MRVSFAVFSVEVPPARGFTECLEQAGWRHTIAMREAQHFRFVRSVVVRCCVVLLILFRTGIGGPPCTCLQCVGDFLLDPGLWILVPREGNTATAL